MFDDVTNEKLFLDSVLFHGKKLYRLPKTAKQRKKEESFSVDCRHRQPPHQKIAVVKSFSGVKRG